MSVRRLLIAYAHPDDESFGSGGLIARYVHEGVEVYLICATDGDRGTIPQEMQGHYATVRELRLAELDCAAEVLALKEVTCFGYQDSGMRGDPGNEDPQSLWYAWEHHPDQVTRRVVEVMRRVRPQVVLTFNRYGGYGHPDHIAIQRATCEAFRLAGDAAYVTDGLEPYQPQKLYFGGLPGGLLRVALWMLRLRGRDPRRMGVNQDIDFQAVVDNLEPTHAVVDVGEYTEQWSRASACHASQGGGGMSSRFGWLSAFFMRRQGFTRVEPSPNGLRRKERDLFEGVV